MFCSRHDCHIAPEDLLQLSGSESDRIFETLWVDCTLDSTDLGALCAFTIVYIFKIDC
jgi:hypothetical protein